MTRGAARIFVLLVLALGCLGLWIGAPAAGLWLAGKLTSSFGPALVLALGFSIAGMLVLGMGLSWVNDLYLRVTGGVYAEGAAGPVRRRGPLEPMIVVSLALAVVAFVAWFFLLAENPTINVY